MNKDEFGNRMKEYESESEKESAMIKLYNKGIGTMELSKIFNCHRTTVQRILKRNNITLRKTSPHKSYNINFFSVYNPESVYWAGFIAADGSIRKDRSTVHIKLASIDREHLEKFKKAIDFKHNVKDRKNYVTIDVNGEWFVSDLLKNYGLKPLKTFDISVHSNIPKSLLNHFIRGYFDGDGCVTRPSNPTVAFSSGSEKMLLDIRNILHSNLDIKLKSKNRVSPLHKTNESTYQFSYAGKNAKLILDWMYKDSKSKTRLERKHLKFLDLFARY